jgi:hypothetical protein
MSVGIAGRVSIAGPPDMRNRSANHYRLAFSYVLKEVAEIYFIDCFRIYLEGLKKLQNP